MSRKKYTSMKSDIDVFRKNWRLKNGKKEVLFSELHSLLTSGLDFGRSFRLLIDGETDKRVKVLLEELYASVIIGHSLWEVLWRVGNFLRWIAGCYGSEKRRDEWMNRCVFWPIITVNGRNNAG